LLLHPAARAGGGSPIFFCRVAGFRSLSHCLFPFEYRAPSPTCLPSRACYRSDGHACFLRLPDEGAPARRPATLLYSQIGCVSRRVRSQLLAVFFQSPCRRNIFATASKLRACRVSRWPPSSPDPYGNDLAAFVWLRAERGPGLHKLAPFLQSIAALVC